MKEPLTKPSPGLRGHCEDSTTMPLMIIFFYCFYDDARIAYALTLTVLSITAPRNTTFLCLTDW